MSTLRSDTDRESLILRAVWMLVFFFVWQLAELALLLVVVGQLVVSAANGRPHEGLQGFGDSLSQYVAQIGRFGTFNTDRKPWPMSDWPKPRPADLETAAPARPAEPRQESQA